MKRQKATRLMQPVSLTLYVSELQNRVLFDLARRFQPNREPNTADVSAILLTHALIDLDELMPRIAHIHSYCTAEGIENQQEYREKLLEHAFPRKKPRRRSKK